MESAFDSHQWTLTMQRKVRRSHPESFALFFIEWIRLLQGYVFPAHVVEFDARRVNEWATLREFAEANESIWPWLDKVALRELVQQRYIRTHVLGRSPESDTEFVQDRVRHGTNYLRLLLGVLPADVIGRHDSNSFESGNPVDLSDNPFAQRELCFTATISLLYQIRCNLFHGVKGFRNRSKRDGLLTSLGVQVLRDTMYTFDHTRREH
jgi:hypothetical protein